MNLLPAIVGAGLVLLLLLPLFFLVVDPDLGTTSGLLPHVAHFSASRLSEHIIIQGQATVVPKRAVTEELTRESLLKEVQYRPHRPAPLLALMQTCPRPISNLCQVSTILRR